MGLKISLVQPFKLLIIVTRIPTCNYRYTVLINASVTIMDQSFDKKPKQQLVSTAAVGITTT